MRSTRRIKWEDLFMRLNQIFHFNTNRYFQNQSFFLILAPFWILKVDITIQKQLYKSALELLGYNLTLVEKAEGNFTILQNLDKRKNRKNQNFLNFIKDKGQILPRGRKSLQQYLGMASMEQLSKEGSGVVISYEPMVSQRQPLWLYGKEKISSNLNLSLVFSMILWLNTTSMTLLPTVKITCLKGHCFLRSPMKH